MSSVWEAVTNTKAAKWRKKPHNFGEYITFGISWYVTGGKKSQMYKMGVAETARRLDVFVGRQHSKKKQLNSRSNSYLLPRYRSSRYRSFDMVPSLATSFRHHLLLICLRCTMTKLLLSPPADIAWRDVSKVSYLYRALIW